MKNDLIILAHTNPDRDKCIVMRKRNEEWGTGFWHKDGNNETLSWGSWMCVSETSWREIDINQAIKILEKGYRGRYRKLVTQVFITTYTQLKYTR